MKSFGLQFAIIALLGIAILALDLLLPLGFAVGALYISCVLLTGELKKSSAVVLVTAGCSLLILLGYWLSPSLGTDYALANRLISLLSIWVTAVFVLQRGPVFSRPETPLRVGPSLSLPSNPQIDTPETLREKTDVLSSILNSITDGVIVADQKGNFLLFNPAAEELTGRGALEGGPESWSDSYGLFMPDGQQPFPQDELPLVRAIQGEVVKEVELRIRRPGQANDAWLSVNGSPLRDWNGEIRGGVAVFRDITEKKASEEVVLAAQKEAERANASKGLFLANMSHEIRTPINAVIGMAELLLDSDLNFQQREYLEIIRESADSLLAVINEILDFSKVDIGDLELNERPFDLDEVLGDVLKSMAFRAHSKNLELASRIPPDLPLNLIGDPVRLRQVIINLVGNAIKFTRQGEVVVEVARQSGDDHHAVFHFQVRDTGIGIPPEMQTSIFEAFKQVDPSSTREFEGTGLGLAICARLIELMKGRIWVESEVGKGSVFHFTARFGIEVSKETTGKLSKTTGIPGMRVLVVDDNVTSRSILADVLRNWGMRPRSVGSGERALQEITEAERRRSPYDLLFIDSRLGRQSGLELAQIIHEQMTGSSKIILMLNAGDPSVQTDGKPVEVNSFLMKPVTASEVFDSVAEALQLSLTGAETPLVTAGTERSLRILLAEDSLANRKLAIGLLERRGHRVRAVENGAKAVQAVKSEYFDLVLMDVQMPVMDGLQATRAIREWESGSPRHVPIIAMTAHAMHGDKEQCLQAGMDDYVPKPVRAKYLFDTIDRCFANQTSVAVPEELTAALETVQGDYTLLIAVVQAFTDECPELLKEARQALARGEDQELQLLAHTLKGSLRHLGLEATADIAYDLEKSASEVQLATAGEHLKKLEARIDEILPVLRQFLEATGTGRSEVD